MYFVFILIQNSESIWNIIIYVLNCHLKFIKLNYQQTKTKIFLI